MGSGGAVLKINSLNEKKIYRKELQIVVLICIFSTFNRTKPKTISNSKTFIQSNQIDCESCLNLN